ncbi:aldehyde ferredoxin oxidoreductase N-terminal domain-containing protein [Thermodesulfobacteriota bacterium]
MTVHERMIIVDLSTERIDIQPMRADLEHEYLGGEGVGTRLVWEMVPPGISAFEPGNTIVFATAPLNGTIFPAGARGCVVFKSPETGTISMSNIGGHWAARLKMAGYAFVAFTGKASRPVYLAIDPGGAELRDGAHLWGKTIPDYEAALRQELGGAAFEAVGIGPAGENLVRLACIANNIRFAGKGGSGAVMGSKNLKAVVIQGDGMVAVQDLWRLRDLSAGIMETMKQAEPIQALKQGSSAAFNQTVFEIQDFGHRHFQEAGWTDTNLYIENIAKNLHEESRACYGCPIGCGVISRVKKGAYKGTETGGPMAEAYWNWGWKCGITDVDAICKIAELCNKNGVCVNSASELAAWMMECQERGLLSTEETGGLQLSWGDGPGSVRMMEMLIRREGFGNVLAEGVKRAAESTGNNTDEYAMHVKGMELDGDEWRQNKASALTAATAERGASVVRPWGFPWIWASFFPR